MGKSEVPALPADSALLEYILMTERRPAMYYGSSNVDDVRHHLEGWRAHRRVVGDNDAFADHFFRNFHSFVEAYYQDNRTIGWNGLLRENTSSEEEGFRTFVSLLKQFASEFAARGA